MCSQQDQLLSLRLHEEVDQEIFASKGTELCDRVAHLSLQLESSDRGRAELGKIAIKAFELSQALNDKRLTADYRAKCLIVEIVCLNFTLDDVTLVAQWRKSFDMLAVGLVSEESPWSWNLEQCYLITWR